MNKGVQLCPTEILSFIDEANKTETKFMRRSWAHTLVAIVRECEPYILRGKDGKEQGYNHSILSSKVNLQISHFDF